MKLLMAGPSPFVRKVLVLLHETGQDTDVEKVNVTASPVGGDADLHSANPLGKIPALVRDDGCTLYDSRVICRYLDARKGAGLYPDSHLWETLTLEATGDGMMEACLHIVYESRFRPQGLRSTEWTDGQWAKFTRACGALNARWTSHLHGRLDAGHIAVGCALGYADFRMPDRDWRSGLDALTAWYTSFAGRPSVTSTVPVG